VTYELKIPYTDFESYTEQEPYEVEVPYTTVEPYQDIQYFESVERSGLGKYWSTCAGACRCTKYGSFPGYNPSYACIECTCTKSTYITRYRNVTKYKAQTLYRDITRMRPVNKIRTEFRETEMNWFFGFNTSYSFHLPIISTTVNAGQIFITGDSNQFTTPQSTPKKDKPSITSEGSNGRTIRTFSYTYKGEPYTLKVPVDPAVYYCAQEAQNKWNDYLNTNYKPNSSNYGDIIEDIYPTILTDPAMDSFYSDLLTELNRARYHGGKKLTDDEYLEMITSFVQQIEYDPNAKDLPRYPIEVIYEGKGDCDEKSILLAALLSKEGYDVAFLAFPEEKHATAGIGIQLFTNPTTFRVFKDRDYKINSNTGNTLNYIYIETTNSSIIGFYPDEFENVRDPIIINVGNGTLQYGKINYVMKIFADAKQIHDLLGSHSQYRLTYSDYYSLLQTYNFVMSTNNVEDARMKIRNSQLRHITNCWSCD
jgi:hypothetical protein